MCRVLAILALIVVLPTLRAQNLTWPEVLARVDSAGGVVLRNGEAAVQHETFPAADTTLTTGVNGFATLVLSTGLTVYLGPSSQLTVVRAQQLEYVDIHIGGEYEETRSDVVIKLVEGRFGFVQPEPDPTSTLSLETRYGKLEGDAAQFAVILDGGDPAAAALQGSLYYISDSGPRRFVAEGEALDLQAASLDNPPEALTKMLARGRLRFEPLVQPAYKSARRTIFLTTGEEPEFMTAVPVRDLDGTAFNDYRSAR